MEDSGPVWGTSRDPGKKEKGRDRQKQRGLLNARRKERYGGKRESDEEEEQKEEAIGDGGNRQKQWQSP